LELAPDVPEIRWNLALTQLQLGDFKNGWRNFETRWQGCASLQGVYPMPLDRAWRGEALRGKRLLLWAEQGFGDTLQFIRFARNVASRGAVVDVLVPPELADWCAMSWVSIRYMSLGSRCRATTITAL
jgi:hypothetical protein